jgi:hypothetical protein
MTFSHSTNATGQQRWLGAMISSQHVYEVPRKDNRGVELISDALPFGRLWYAEPNAISSAVGYAKFYSRSHDAVIWVLDPSKVKMKVHTCPNRNI